MHALAGWGIYEGQSRMESRGPGLFLLSAFFPCNVVTDTVLPDDLTYVCVACSVLS